MADVTLILKADNSDHIRKMRQAQTETQKVFDTAAAGGKREKGILEEIDERLTRLQRARQKAFSIEEIEKYNKKIQETKLNLQEYEQAGLKADKQTATLTQTIGKWALSLGGAAVILRTLTSALKETTAGLNFFNIAGAVTKQVLNDIVTGAGISIERLVVAGRVQKVLNEERLRNAVDVFKAAQHNTKYQQLYVESINQALAPLERLKKIDAALAEHNIAIDIEIANKQREIDAINDLIKQSDDDKLKLRFAQLNTDLVNLEGERVSSTKRLQTAKFNILKELEDQHQKTLELIRKAADEEVEANTEAAKKLAKQRHDQSVATELENQKLLKDRIAEKKKEEEAEWDREIEFGEKLFTQQKKRDKEIFDQRIENAKKLADAEEKVAEMKSDNLQSAGEAVISYISIVDEMQQREVDHAQLQRELLDTQISETQAALQTEVELAKAGFANNVAAKQKEIDDLKKARDKALADEEAARKKAHALKVASLVAEKAVALAKVIMGAETAKAEVLPLLANPITLAAGIAARAAIGISEAISIAAITASIIAASTSKFAKGGPTGKGSFRDSTGERVAGIVHEDEFVVRRGPAHKFREVLDAINRNDRQLVINRFNKMSGELLGGTTVNNVVVENTGPNKRLDRLIELNKKQSKEEVIISGNTTVYKKGLTLRTVKII